MHVSTTGLPQLAFVASLAVLAAPFAPAEGQRQDLSFLDEPPTYFVEELGVLAAGSDPEASTYALAIDSKGRVAGESQVGPGVFAPSHVFLWNEGALRDATASWKEASFLDFNSKNWLMGRFIDDLPVSTFFLLKDGEVLIDSVPNPLPGTSMLTYAMQGMNEQGQIAGWGSILMAGVLGTRKVAFVWSPDAGVSEALPPLDGEDAWAWDVNEAGDVCGEAAYGDPFGPKHAVLWIDGKVHDLHDPSLGLMSRARAISATAVVGIVEAGSVHPGEHAFRWIRGKGMQLLPELPGAIRSRSQDVNDAAAVVGESDSVTGERAVIWQGDGVWPLFERVVNPEGWNDLWAATGIDDEGRICGWGSYKTSPTYSAIRGFRLVPAVADFDRDRDVDADDLAAFLMAIAARHPSADLDGDGSFGNADLTRFLEHFVRDASRASTR